MHVNQALFLLNYIQPVTVNFDMANSWDDNRKSVTTARSHTNQDEDSTAGWNPAAHETKSLFTRMWLWMAITRQLKEEVIIHSPCKPCYVQGQVQELTRKQMANQYVLAFSIKNVISGMCRRNSFLLSKRQLVAQLFTQICRRNTVRVIIRKLLMDDFSLPCKFRKQQGCTWKGFGKSRMNSNHRAIVSSTSSKLDLTY